MPADSARRYNPKLIYRLPERHWLPSFSPFRYSSFLLFLFRGGCTCEFRAARHHLLAAAGSGEIPNTWVG